MRASWIKGKHGILESSVMLLCCSVVGGVFIPVTRQMHDKFGDSQIFSTKLGSKSAVYSNDFDR